MRKFVPWFRPIGISMCIISLVIPFLIITHVIESTFFLNCLTMLFNFYGVVLWVYGYSLRKVSRIKDEQLSQRSSSFTNRSEIKAVS